MIGVKNLIDEEVVIQRYIKKREEIIASGKNVEIRLNAIESAAKRVGLWSKLKKRLETIKKGK